MDLSAVAVPAVRLGGAPVQLVTDVQAAGGGVVRSQDVEASGDEELQRKERMAVVTTEGGRSCHRCIGSSLCPFQGGCSSYRSLRALSILHMSVTRFL